MPNGVDAVAVYLVRHGAAEGAEGWCVGHCDLPLSEAGRADVARLAAGWTGPRPARVFASDLRRARDSAAALAGAWGGAVEADARLREMDFGAWDGRPWDALGRDDGARLGAWMAAWDEAPAPGGEGFPDVVARAGGWLDDAVRRSSEAGDASVLAVAHAGSIRAALVHALGLPRRLAFALRVDHARVSALRVRPDVAPGAPGRAELLVLNADRVPAAPFPSAAPAR